MGRGNVAGEKYEWEGNEEEVRHGKRRKGGRVRRMEEGEEDG